MRPVPRVVLDTNVVLSALLFAQGRLARLRLAWQQASFHPLVSKATAAEFMRALTYPKFKLTAEEQRELLADYLPYCTSIVLPAKPPRAPPCRDPFDVPFLQLAVVGKADYLVTGDKDLLSLNGRIRCPVVTAEALLTSLEHPECAAEGAVLFLEKISPVVQNVDSSSRALGSATYAPVEALVPIIPRRP